MPNPLPHEPNPDPTPTPTRINYRVATTSYLNPSFTPLFTQALDPRREEAQAELVAMGFVKPPSAPLAVKAYKTRTGTELKDEP